MQIIYILTNKMLIKQFISINQIFYYVFIEYNLKQSISMQLKNLLSKSKSKHKLNCDTKSYKTIQLTKTLKRCDSAVSLRKKDNDLCQIEMRYKMLQQNYQNLLLQTRKRTQLYNHQKEQISKMKIRGQKDRTQIQRLRMMLGFIHKIDYSTQTNIQIDRPSWHTKVQKSTVSDFRQTADNWISSKCNNTAIQLHSSITPSKKKIDYKQMRKQSTRKTKSPTNKYRFIPSLPFNR